MIHENHRTEHPSEDIPRHVFGSEFSDEELLKVAQLGKIALKEEGITLSSEMTTREDILNFLGTAVMAIYRHYLLPK